MTWTRKTLRIWSAFCLALVVYAATPHAHGEAHAWGSDAAAVRGSAALVAAGGGPLAEKTGELRRDDDHASHSQVARTDGHPCTLCRDKSDRALAGIAAAPLRPMSIAVLRVDRVDVALRPELLIARRHPARGPPASC